MNTTKWTSHPLKEEPKTKSLLLITIIFAVSIVVHLSFQNMLFALTALILLTASMTRYFCPTNYTIDKTGFTISYLFITRHYPWTEFHRADRHTDGIFISPFTKPNRLDSFRGQFLRTTNPDEIYHVIQHHIQTDPA